MNAKLLCNLAFAVCLAALSNTRGADAAGRPNILETDYEGANLPLRKSVAGAMKGRENALRDPAIFVDADGRVYLLYSVAGESGIGLAELKQEPGTNSR